MFIDNSWQNSSVFLIYLDILLGILIVAGIALAFLTFVLHRDVRRVWATYAGWLILAPLTFGAIYLGRWPTILLFDLFAFFGFKEFARVTGLRRARMITGAGYLLILTAGVAAIIRDPANSSPGWLGLYMSLPVCAVALFFLIPIFQNRAQGQLHTASLAILGFLCVGWMFMHLALFADIPNGMGYLLYLLLAVELNDVAAFTCGSLFGRHQKHLLRSQISPNKTWEGAIGAMAFSMMLPWLLRFSLPHFGTVQLMLTGLIVTIGGQLGDLSMSVVKRDVGVKNMGYIIPGHGGVLDRIDSLIYAAPLFLHMILFFDKQG